MAAFMSHDEARRHLAARRAWLASELQRQRRAEARTGGPSGSPAVIGGRA